MKIRVIDFETTGMAPPAIVIEAGWCDVDAAGYSTERCAGGLWGSVRADMFYALTVPPEAQAVHHIQASWLQNKMPFDSQRFVNDAVDGGVFALAAHNAAFEAAWLRDGPLPMICTYKAALRLWPDAPGYGNQVLRYWLADQGLLDTGQWFEFNEPPHRAGPDAYITALILLAELKLTDIATMLVWTDEPALLPRLPIGKQRGEKWADVDEGFLAWMLRQPDMESDLVWNARRELMRRGLLVDLGKE